MESNNAGSGSELPFGRSPVAHRPETWFATPENYLLPVAQWQRFATKLGTLMSTTLVRHGMSSTTLPPL
eukprot:4070960-Amphidinium_carterae.1